MSGQIAAGMGMAVDLCNRKGGLAGERVHLELADHGFDQRRAREAVAALCASKIPLAFVGSVGSAPNLAVLSELERRQIPNLFPLAAAAALYEPPHPLRYAHTPSYFLQMEAAARYVVVKLGASRVGVICQDDAFGDEVLAGTISGLADEHASVLVEERIRVGQADAVRAIDAIEAADCDWVLLGTMLKDTVSLLREARDRGLRARFLGSISTHTELMQSLGGTYAEDFWSVATSEIPNRETADEDLRIWQQEYEQTVGSFPGAYSVHGFLSMRHVLTAASRVRGTISARSLCKVLESTTLDGSPFGGDLLHFAPDSHLGSRRVRLASIQNRHWVNMTGYIGACGS